MSQKKWKHADFMIYELIIFITTSNSNCMSAFLRSHPFFRYLQVLLGNFYSQAQKSNYNVCLSNFGVIKWRANIRVVQMFISYVIYHYHAATENDCCHTNLSPHKLYNYSSSTINRIHITKLYSHHWPNVIMINTKLYCTLGFFHQLCQIQTFPLENTALWWCSSVLSIF